MHNWRISSFYLESQTLKKKDYRDFIPQTYQFIEIVDRKLSVDTEEETKVSN